MEDLLNELLQVRCIADSTKDLTRIAREFDLKTVFKISDYETSKPIDVDFD